MTIPTIGVRDITVPTVYVPNWLNSTPNVDHLVPPVVLNIGNPIIDMPGCNSDSIYNFLHDFFNSYFLSGACGVI